MNEAWFWVLAGIGIPSLWLWRRITGRSKVVSNESGCSFIVIILFALLLAWIINGRLFGGGGT